VRYKVDGDRNGDAATKRTGIYDLERTDSGNDIELAYFGLAPKFIGRGDKGLSCHRQHCAPKDEVDFDFEVRSGALHEQFDVIALSAADAPAMVFCK
jgi:hypothetical protein